MAVKFETLQLDNAQSVPPYSAFYESKQSRVSPSLTIYYEERSGSGEGRTPVTIYKRFSVVVDVTERSPSTWRVEKQWLGNF